jgi:hypothetical protein
MTTYDAAAEPFHILHMGSISDDAVSKQLLSPYLCQAMPLTIYAAAEPFHVLHMGPMSDDSVSNQLLSPHLYHKPCHFLGCHWQKVCTLPLNLGQYSLNSAMRKHFISSVLCYQPIF